ncbi:MAG TPA: universal stress protein [Solirubrobacterales bacterium]|nr:universal stress protein [Solirubrobacterales bacterium]
MNKTRERTRKRYTSPTAAAPVVVGFDGADGGRDALELARTLGEIRGTRCVVAVPRLDGLGGEARAALEDPDAEVREIGVLSPADMLMRLAEREHAGTLVVGASRADRLERAIIRTTAERLLRHAPCEVVVAPRGYAAKRHRRYAKIAVAVDGTPESKVALSRAEDLARQAGAAIEVLVADDPVVAGIQAEFPHDAPPSLAKVLEAAVGSVDPKLSPTGKRVDAGWQQIARTVAAALAAACGPDVDLLVTGSRRPIEHFLAGSVTGHLVNESACPVLVVPNQRKV